MAWLACNKNGEEGIYDSLPTRNNKDKYWEYELFEEYGISLTPGSIKKLIGRELTWKDEPVEI